MMEQRKDFRFHVQFRSSFSSIAMIGGEGSLMDLSLMGCRIESLIDVTPGASLELQIEATEHGPPIHIQAAIVRWNRERQFGLEFEVIAPTEWAHLQDIVKQIESWSLFRRRSNKKKPIHSALRSSRSSFRRHFACERSSSPYVAVTRLTVLCRMAFASAPRPTS
jgi:hypothetical protein